MESGWAESGYARLLEFALSPERNRTPSEDFKQRSEGIIFAFLKKITWLLCG